MSDATSLKVKLKSQNITEKDKTVSKKDGKLQQLSQYIVKKSKDS